jgi:hypothetical protein
MAWGYCKNKCKINEHDPMPVEGPSQAESILGLISHTCNTCGRHEYDDQERIDQLQELIDRLEHLEFTLQHHTDYHNEL